MVGMAQVIETRMNSMFELATQDEIDKLRQVNTLHNFMLPFISL
jgi:hypothetical protein